MWMDLKRFVATMCFDMMLDDESVGRPWRPFVHTNKHTNPQMKRDIPPVSHAVIMTAVM